MRAFSVICRVHHQRTRMMKRQLLLAQKNICHELAESGSITAETAEKLIAEVDAELEGVE